MQDLALTHHGHTIPQPERLVDVMRHKDNGGAEPALDVAQIVLGFGADNGIEGAKRLVHEQNRRLGGQGAGYADALLLPAGELMRKLGRQTLPDRAERR